MSIDKFFKKVLPDNNAIKSQKIIFIHRTIGFNFIASSCLVKKKYVAVQDELDSIKSELLKTRVEKEDFETKYAKIQKRVSSYYPKINSSQKDDDNKLEMVGDLAPVSNKSKEIMRKTLKNVDPDKSANATTLSDSIDLAIS